MPRADGQSLSLPPTGLRSAFCELPPVWESYLRPPRRSDEPRPSDDPLPSSRSSRSSLSGRDGLPLLNQPWELLSVTGDLGRLILSEELRLPIPSLGEDSLRSLGLCDAAGPPGLARSVAPLGARDRLSGVTWRELDSLVSRDASGTRRPDSTFIRSWRNLSTSLERLRTSSRCLSSIRENLKGTSLLLV